MRTLLMLLGERLVLDVEPLAEAGGEAVARSPRERLREAASWNLVATQLEIAGAQARRAGHPATRSTAVARNETRSEAQE
jgi:hypothetical protein